MEKSCVVLLQLSYNGFCVFSTLPIYVFHIVSLNLLATTKSDATEIPNCDAVTRVNISWEKINLDSHQANHNKKPNDLHLVTYFHLSTICQTVTRSKDKRLIFLSR